MPLNPRQRKHLKALAHNLDPVVRVGRSRVTRELVDETDRTLEAHELIKVKVDNDDSAARRALAEDLASQSTAELVGTIGKIAILYRARREKPTIKLPS